MNGPAVQPGRMSGWLRAHATVLAGIVLLVALYGAASVRYQHFMTLGVFLNLLDDRAALGIVAVGVTLVIISGGIDLSVGAVMSLSGIVVAKLIVSAGWPAWAAIGFALGTGAAFGALQGLIIQGTGLGAFIVTLAGMFMARGIGFLVSLASIGITDEGHSRLARLDLRLALGDAPDLHGTLRIGAMIMLGAAAVVAYIATFTRFGRAVYALGGSEEAALLMGLPVARTRVGVYALSGFCAALAGATLTLQLSSATHSEGVGMELDAIAAVVIGGALLSGGSGSILGTLVGTLIIGLILTVAMTYEGGLTSGTTRVLIAALLLLFVILQKLLSRLARRGTGPGTPL